MIKKTIVFIGLIGIGMVLIGLKGLFPLFGAVINGLCIGYVLGNIGKKILDWWE